ncbi:hypothetical protein QTN25_000326 [Entamoeba marina]
MSHHIYPYNKSLDSYSLMIVSKYLKTETDFLNVICVCKKFCDLLDKFHYNPISPTRLFHRMETQYIYNEEEIKLPNISRYVIWYAYDYSKDLYLKENVHHYVENYVEKQITYKNLYLKKVDTPISIPKGIATISEECFSHDPIEKIDSIPLSVRRLGQSCFTRCQKLVSVELPKSITYIDVNCFNHCTKLNAATISCCLLKLQSEMCFKDCIALQTITLPAMLTNIGNSAFAGCKQLQNIIFPPSLLSLSNGCFSKYLPPHLSSVGCYCFDNCSKLKSINLPSSLLSLGLYAFNDCPSLYIINLPVSLTRIGKYAFSKCSFLSNIFLSEPFTYVKSGKKKIITRTHPKTKESIEIDIKSHFVNCGPLNFIHDQENTIIKKEISYKEYLNCKQFNTNTVCKIIKYTKEDKNSYGSNIPSCVNMLDDNCFENESLETITLPPTVSFIGNNCFSNAFLTAIQLPNTLNTLSEGCFCNCVQLKSVLLPRAITKIPAECFKNCQSLNYIELPKSVEVIGRNAFFNCSSLKQLCVPTSVKDYGELCFFNCPFNKKGLPFTSY